MNDPNFVPDMQLPQFDLDALVADSQRTNKTSSQMSPFGDSYSSNSVGSAGSRLGFDMQIDLPHSDSPRPRRSVYGIQGLSSSHKPESEHLLINPDENFSGRGDWGMDIDENGEIIERAEPVIVQDEFDLPPLPRIEGDDQIYEIQEQQEEQPIVDENGDVFMMDRPLPEDGLLPERQLQDAHNSFRSDAQLQQATARRKRKARILQADEETEVPRTVMTNWQKNYLTNCTVKKPKPMGAAISRANAMLLTFGFGLSNVGKPIGLPGVVHPLALDFSGDKLFTALTGLEVIEQSRGRRRAASELIEDEDEGQRRVRPRLEDDAVQQGWGLESDGILGGDNMQPVHSSPELGREAPAPMSDHLSSALRMPWNQVSSVPGSSIRGSAQKGRALSSPLGNRHGIQDIVHYDDGPSFGDDDFGLGGRLHLQDDSFQGIRLEEEGGAQTQGDGEGADLDIQSRNFLAFMDSAVREHGERREDEDYEINRRWVALNDIFVPKDTSRATAAQAFYHTLSLATQGKVKVSQDEDSMKPFGEIWVGFRL